MKNPAEPYRDALVHALRDRAEASRYLNAALDDGDKRVFLLALRDVAQAQGGLGRLAKLARLNRENLYRMLSDRGNPELAGLGNLLGAMGFRLAVRQSRTQPHA